MITAAEYRAITANPRNKFGARRTTLDGISFASKAEAARYGQLKLEERAGLIIGLECHPRFVLHANGCHIGCYTADFAYRRRGVAVVEDVKSPPTRLKADYRLRKRLMKACHNIEITEVMP